MTPPNPDADEMREVLASDLHEAWRDSKRRQGFASRKAEDGEELMVPYALLSEKQKDTDRIVADQAIGSLRRRGAWLPGDPLTREMLIAGSAALIAHRENPGVFTCGPAQACITAALNALKETP